MTPELYQCQYEKATKCAMDLPCLGCETHAKYAVVAKAVETPVMHELNISVKSLEWRREVHFDQISFYQSDAISGRALVKSEVVADTDININLAGIHAISVNGEWYMPAPHYGLDKLWEKLK